MTSFRFCFTLQAQQRGCFEKAVCIFPSCLFESCCLSKVEGLVGMWSPAALCRYSNLCFQAQAHQNDPVRLLSHGTSCCSTEGLKLFLKHFHCQRCVQQQLVCLFAQLLKLERCRMEIPHPIWRTNQPIGKNALLDFHT